MVGDDASDVVSEPAVARLEGRAMPLPTEDGIVVLLSVAHVSIDRRVPQVWVCLQDVEGVGRYA